MPGIENAAPERTETSSGFFGSPNFLPTFSSIFFKPSWTCSHMPSGKFLSFSKNALQASVVTTSPGGTGNPARVISHNPAPLPPSNDLSSPGPSSKRETHLCVVVSVVCGVSSVTVLIYYTLSHFTHLWKSSV